MDNLMNNIDDTMNEINVLECEIKQQKKEQDTFNTKFIIKFWMFFTFYRFFSTYIDQEGIVANCVENTFNDLTGGSEESVDEYVNIEVESVD
jgi:hypothetical protein